MIKGMEDSAQVSSPSHQAVDRALRVITYLGGHPAGASLQEVSAATGIPKPSLHRTLSSMRERGFASQLKLGGLYLLGPAAMEAAFSFHSNLDFREFLRPLLTEIQSASGQTIHLATLEAAEVLYFDKLESSIGVRLTSVIGGRNPTHATGVGKALLAAKLPDRASVDSWIAQYGPLAARTSRTITTASALAKDLDETRNRGYAIDDEESEIGLFCVAATVPLVFGSLVPPLAISVTGLKSTMLSLGVDALGKSLTKYIAEFEYGSRTNSS